MTTILVPMLVVVAVAVLALAYAAFPHRGAPVPGMPWINDVLERAVDAVPVVQDGDLDPLANPFTGAGAGRGSGDLPARR